MCICVYIRMHKYIGSVRVHKFGFKVHLGMNMNSLNEYTPEDVFICAFQSKQTNTSLLIHAQHKLSRSIRNVSLATQKGA